MSLTERQPSWLSRLFRRVLVGMYKSGGWRAHGVVPEPRKFVLIAAPHTSNWDFVNFLGLTADLKIRPHFMAKLSLFRWPLGGFMKQMGGVPVDRRGGGNVVEQMVAEFARRAEFIAAAVAGVRGWAVAGSCNCCPARSALPFRRLRRLSEATSVPC